MNEDKMIETLIQVERERAAWKAGVKGALGFDMDQWYSACLTVACLAGHAAVANGWALMNSIQAVEVKTGRIDQIEEVGQEVLDLTDAEADEVFFLENLAAVYEWVADAMGVSEQVLRDKVQAAR